MADRPGFLATKNDKSRKNSGLHFGTGLAHGLGVGRLHTVSNEGGNMYKRLFLSIVALASLTSCGVRSKTSDVEVVVLHDAYVKYSVYKIDHGEETLAVHGAIPLNEGDETDIVRIQDEDWSDLEFRWTVDGDELNIRLVEDGDTLSDKTYDADVFVGGYSNKEIIYVHHGHVYEVVLESSMIE